MTSKKVPPNPTHVKGTAKGEERVQKKGPEPGRRGNRVDASGKQPGEGSSRVSPVRGQDPDSPTILNP